MLPKVIKILYGTGLGAGAPYVCRYALSVAREYGATITAVHAVEPLSPFGQSLVELHVPHSSSEKMHSEARNKVRSDLEARLSELVRQETGNTGTDTSLVEAVKVIEGQPSQVILDEARAIGADLIILGSHRHSAIGDALLGHTANKVSHRSEIPVLLVPIPAGFEE